MNTLLLVVYHLLTDNELGDINDEDIDRFDMPQGRFTSRISVIHELYIFLVVSYRLQYGNVYLCVWRAMFDIYGFLDKIYSDSRTWGVDKWAVGPATRLVVELGVKIFKKNWKTLTEWICVSMFFTLNRSFYPSTSSTTSQCPGRFFNHRGDTSYVVTKKATPQRYYVATYQVPWYAVSTAVGDAMPLICISYANKQYIYLVLVYVYGWTSLYS